MPPGKKPGPKGRPPASGGPGRGRKLGPVSASMARKMGMDVPDAPGGRKTGRGASPAGKEGRFGKPEGGGRPEGNRPDGPRPGRTRPGQGKGPARPVASGEERAPRPGRRREVAETAPRGRAPRIGARPEGEEEDRPEPESEMVWGRHAVMAAVRSGRPVNKVWLQRSLEDAKFATAIRMQAREAGVAVVEVERQRLDNLVAGPHQGVVASLAPVAYQTFAKVLEVARAAERPLLLLLEGIEDPGNLGALIRSAEAAGAQGVVIPQRRAVGLTGAVAKAAAGALDLVPVARVVNLAQAIRDLQAAGFWVVAADGAGEELPWQVDMKGPIALLVGSEGRGLSRNLLETCDHVVRLPMPGKTPSLNASVAGGILLFEAVRQRT
ncbi:MAG: 23S rRNA (guanosine(2251)-2'-O)-methyltransferase RlmB [Candidatus Sericytochromatia bacterium]|nr:23S rRNA (guanosine(2251)-2'-O)-methyltransferase RlmB [Candidatus Tanganyikabacteria bacterium]